MWAYLAVIQDSFREAFASRVLWVLLALITVLLLALAPLGSQQQVTRELGESAVRDWPHFLEHLRDEAGRSKPSPARRIAGLLPPDVQRTLQDFRFPRDGDVSGAFRMIGTIKDLRQALNGLLVRRDFYDPAAWADTPLGTDEARDLAAQDRAKMSEDDLGRLNRLALEAAFPDFVAPSPPTSVRFRYLWYDFGEPLPLRKSEFKRILESIVEWVTKWLVGTLGVFVAILVTASIIPQTFDPGSLNLLLSKPVWRWLLFLSKFFGGCAFILLNAAYLVTGLWLILGCRFGMWAPGILWCIPVYVFMFAIYYTISALAGLVWRNAIVSVVMTVLFWIVCFTVGVSKSGIEQMVLNKMRIIQLIQAKQTLVSVTEAGLTYRWDESAGRWTEILQGSDEEELQRRIALAVIPAVPPELRLLGPVYDRSGDRLISAARSLRTGQLRLNVGRHDQDWRAERGAAAPIGTQSLLCEPDGGLLLVSSVGLYRLSGDPAWQAGSLQLFGLSIPLPSGGPFLPVGPDPTVLLVRPSAAAINQDTGELALYSGGTITLLSQTGEGRYERRLERKWDTQTGADVVLAFGGDTLLAGREDGRITVYDAENLNPRHEFTVEGKNQPRFVAVAPGGRHFAVVFHHGRLWLYDRTTGQLTRPRVTGQRDISCAAFPSADRLWVADRATRVSEYRLPDVQLETRWSPPLSLVERIYRYGLAPVYTVFPKPRELDKTIAYVLSGKQTGDFGAGDSDLGTAQTNLHPWRPVWSSLAFMAVMLLAGCVYLHRQDF